MYPLPTLWWVYPCVIESTSFVCSKSRSRRKGTLRVFCLHLFNNLTIFSSSFPYPPSPASVQPLVNRLKNQQEQAVEKLQRSNDAILQHVRQTATEHIYTLLQNSKVKEDKEEATEKAVEKKAAEKEEIEAAKDVAKLKADQEVDA